MKSGVDGAVCDDGAVCLVGVDPRGLGPAEGVHDSIIQPWLYILCSVYKHVFLCVKGVDGSVRDDGAFRLPGVDPLQVGSADRAHDCDVKIAGAESCVLYVNRCGRCCMR